MKYLLNALLALVVKIFRRGCGSCAPVVIAALAFCAGCVS